jgi:hypothetical protein
LGISSSASPACTLVAARGDQKSQSTPGAEVSPWSEKALLYEQ